MGDHQTVHTANGTWYDKLSLTAGDKTGASAR